MECTLVFQCVTKCSLPFWILPYLCHSPFSNFCNNFQAVHLPSLILEPFPRNIFSPLFEKQIPYNFCVFNLMKIISLHSGPLSIE